MRRDPRFNDEQLKVVEAKDSNIIVTASAGAGKTTVLVERFVKRLVEDNVKIDEIIALTFTDAASENMRYRIKEKIDNLLNDTETKDHEKQTLREIKSQIDNAQISTIHAYCLRLIKEYYYLLGIDADRINHIVDDPTKEALKKEAFKLTIDETKDYIKYAGYVSNSIFSFDEFKKTLDEIVNVASNHYDPIKFFSSKIDKKAKRFEDIDENVRKYHYEELKAYVNLAYSYAKELSSDKVFVPVATTLKKAAEANTYSDMLDALKELKKLPTPSAKKDDDPERHALRKYLNDSIIGDKIIPRLIDEKDLLMDYNLTVDTNNYFLKIASTYYQKYEDLKEKYNVIDFNDFEHFAYKLLTLNRSYLANKLKNKYREIMIDEFQDTNDTQYAILSLITNNNLFIVGDIKQSIYRFRNANPKIMERLLKDDSFIHLNMSYNYRSSKPIVDFNNSLYGSLMNFYEDSTFKNDDIQQFGATYNDKTKKPCLILGEKDNADKYDLFADVIKAWKNEGVSLSDICVLTRTHDKKKEIKNVLLKNNIPCISYDKESYLTTKSLDILYSYFKYLINHDDLIAKCTVLSSPIYKVTDDELLQNKSNKFDNDKLNKDVENLDIYVANNDILGIINYILDINNYYYDLTVQQKADIDLFISELNSMNVNTLIDLVAYINANREIPGKEAITVTSDTDAVKIMTIHSSKGLEFKYVILLSESSTNLKKSKSSVLCDSELGIGTYNIYSKYEQKRNTIKRMAILAKENIEDLLEYQRLFYVATTRAINSLHIIDEAKLCSNSKDYFRFNNKLALLYARKGYTSYLLNSFFVDKNDYFVYALVNELLFPSPLSVIKTDSNYKYVPTNIFNTNIIESKRASEFNYSITLKEVFEFGNAVHKYFETMDIYGSTDEEEIKNIFKANAPKVIKAVNSFKNSYVIQKLKSFEIEHEYSYVYKDGNSITRGAIDFMAIDKNIIYLIDFKTDRKSTKEELKEHYKDQINTYKEILYNQYDQVIVAYLYSIELCEFIEM